MSIEFNGSTSLLKMGETFASPINHKRTLLTQQVNDALVGRSQCGFRILGAQHDRLNGVHDELIGFQSARAKLGWGAQRYQWHQPLPGNYQSR